MQMRRYLPTKKSRTRSFLLLIIMSIIYMIDTPSIVSLMNDLLFIYVIKPVLWIGIALFILMMPRIHHSAKQRYNGYLKWLACNFAVIYVAVSVGGGFIDGFGKSPYGHSLTGIILNIIIVGTPLVARELSRSYIANSLTKDENYLIFILIALFMAITNIPLNSFLKLRGLQKTVIFAAQYFAPEFGKSLFATYLAFLGGAVPAIIYLGIIEAVNWLSPILPNLKWITSGVIGVLCPAFSFTALQGMYIKESRQRKLRDKEEESFFGWMGTVIFSIGIIWFSVGVFPIFPSVIVTGSMEPLIMPGDVTLVKKNVDKMNLKVGDIIQFKSDNILISHRIIEKVDEDGKPVYRTKGDNNSTADFNLVKPEDIKGTIIKIIPKIGWPTLLLKSRNDVPLEKVQF